MSLADRFDISSRRGWIRVWLLGSIAWIIFATFQTPPPWDVAPERLVSRPILRGQDPNVELARARAQPPHWCKPGSIETLLEPFPQPPKEVPQPTISEREAVNRMPHPKMSFDARRQLFEDIQREIERQNERENEYVRRLDYWKAEARHFYGAPYNVPEPQAAPTHWLTVSCLDARVVWDRWLKALAFFAVPPIALPIAVLLVIILITKTWRWLANGFRKEGLNSGSNLAASTDSLTKIEIVQPSESIPEIDISLRLKPFGNWLGWSVFFSVVGDQMARAALSGGKSHGLNILLFAIAAGAIYFGCKRSLRKWPEQSSDFGSRWLTYYWLVAVAIIALTTSRYWL